MNDPAAKNEIGAGTALLLEARALDAGYRGQAVVRGLDLEVHGGEMVCLLGANGAGKTTVLRTLAGELPAVAGEVRLFGQASTEPLYRRVRQGLAYITDERSLIFGLSVRDNLSLRSGSVASALELFPELEPLLERRAALLSGGEQQMVTMARCLAARPGLLIADELSMGLAPKVVDRLLQRLRDAADSGLAVLLVEQHMAKALACCDRGYVLGRGKMALSGSSEALRQRHRDIEKAYITG
jgi:ABC-type branched-subunit amino acid transport system ATPase component